MDAQAFVFERAGGTATKEDKWLDWVRRGLHPEGSYYLVRMLLSLRSQGGRQPVPPLFVKAVTFALAV